MIAGLLLAGRPYATKRGLAFSRVDEVVSAIGVSRSRAYEVKDELEALLPALGRPPGRPRAEPGPTPLEQHAAVTFETLDCLMRFPGCVQAGEDRTRYSEY